MALDLKDAVKQQTISLGTDDFLLGAKLAGWRAFDDVYVGGECFVYEAHAVNSAGSRTGDFEVGIGQFLAVAGGSKIARVSVLDSSNGGLKTVFSAGKKHVSICVSAAQARYLTVDYPDDSGPSIFVRADGSDSNSGFANTATGAFRTLDAASDLASSFIASNIYVNGSGDFGCLTVSRPGSSVALIGDSVSAGYPTARVRAINVEAGASVFTSGYPDMFSLDYVTAWGAGAFAEVTGVWFGAIGDGSAIDNIAHIQSSSGGFVRAQSYKISSQMLANHHVLCEPHSRIRLAGQIAVESDMSFDGGFIWAGDGLGHIAFEPGCSFSSGAHIVSSPRVMLRGGSVLMLSGLPFASIPGSQDGVIDSGGQVLL